MKKLIWGIDLGGTKIEGAVLAIADSIEDGYETKARIRVPTQQSDGYAAILDRISELLQTLQDKVGAEPSSIGVGTPGSLIPGTGLLKNSNTQCLNGKPIHRDLESKLGIPVRIENDANCFALAEASLGAAKSYPLVFGIILGTGVGGGISYHHRTRSGPNGVSGEWGHNIIDPGGAPCYCGLSGCVEATISGPALQSYYQSLTGDTITFEEIIELAQGDNEPAQMTQQRFFDFFGRALAQVVNILDPDVVVIGGGLSNVDQLYEETPGRVLPYLFNTEFCTPVLKNELGDSAGVFGAASLTLD